MMRGTAFLLLSALLTGVVLLPATAHAKGSKLRFVQETYAPGDRAVARAEVETWPGAGNEPDGGPCIVYLVRGTHPLHYGHLPRDAIRVGELDVGSLVAADTYRVNVAFEVPRIPDGRYAVWVCRAECGANTGFGDLVYGHTVVTRERRVDAALAPQELAAPSTPQGTTRRAGFPWTVLALAALAGAILAGGLYVRWSHRRPEKAVRT
jgi:hypothetical protein